MTLFTGDSYFRDRQFPFHIDLYPIRKGESIPLHTHDFVEFVFVVYGSADHEMSGNRYRLQSGDVFVLEPNVYHSYSCSDTEEAAVYNVLFDAEFLRKELDSLTQMPSFVNFFYLAPFLRRSASFVAHNPLQPQQKSFIQKHLEFMHEEFLEMREGYQLLIKTRWIECLVWLGRFLQDNQSSSGEKVSDAAWIESVKYYVGQHFRQKLTLQQLGRLCGMSTSSFVKKFKEAAGCSFLDYKHKVQIEHACHLLADSRRKVLDIALDVGFNDVSFFNKIFMKHTGTTPRDFRRRFQQT